jgi:hypothetical protein
MRLTMEQRRAVVARTASRYQRSRKKEKGLILDELVVLTEYSRAYARRVGANHDIEGKELARSLESLVDLLLSLEAIRGHSLPGSMRQVKIDSS